MNSVEEIVALWKEMGISTLEEYKRTFGNMEWFEKNFENFKKFDPNIIDCKMFWEAAELCFGSHPVSPTDAPDIKTVNYNNHQLALQTGAINCFNIINYNFSIKNITPKIAEIGCGYGSFKEYYIEPNNIENYTGFDILTRQPWVVPIEGKNGCFSEEQMATYKEKFNVVYSSNVFQHLNRYQVITYLKQIYDILELGGYFIFGYVDSKNNTSFQYGQLIELIPLSVLHHSFYENNFACVASSSLYSPRGLRPHTFLLQKMLPPEDIKEIK